VLEASRSAVETARANAQLAQNKLLAAQFVRAAAAARLFKTGRDQERAKKLFAEGVIPQSSLDEANEARDIDAADQKTAEKLVAVAERSIAIADSQLEEALKRAQASRAALEESRANFGDTQIQAPVDGVISTKVAEEGEVLPAGAAIAVITDLDHLYMKAYVPSLKSAKIKLGDPGRIFVDAYPDRAFPGKIEEIAPRSEFTPKEVQTREERTKQVVAVKIYLDSNPQHMLVPGMPADAAIRWKPDAPWVNPLDH